MSNRLSCLLILGAAAAVLGAAPVARADHAEGSSTVTGKRRYVVAAIGDSLTDTRVRGGKYMEDLGRMCPKSRFDAFGVGGQQTRHMRWRFTQDLFGDGLRGAPPKPHYTHAIVLGGVNDLSGGLADEARLAKTRENLSWMYRTGRERGLQMVAMTVPPWGGWHGARDRALTEELNGWIMGRVAAGEVDAAVDIHPLLVCGETEVLCPRLRIIPADPIHWGADGHEAVAEKLHEEVFKDCE